MLTILIFGVTCVLALVSRAYLVDLQSDVARPLIVGHADFVGLQQGRAFVGPGDDGLGIAPNTAFENRVATLRKSCIFEDSLEHRRRRVAGSAGKTAKRNGQV